ncbi:MAG: flagellar motor switch protein FliG [Deltaproteobacteria bacterium]|nr:flagellar motor switch protein FliG [Deltaproteobacteria bacterium]
MAQTKYSGPQKAAILLLSFGEDVSAEIFKNMNEFEIKRIGSAMSRLGRLEQDIVDEVMMEFYEILQQNKKFFYGGSEFTKKVIGNAFKGGDADELIDQLSLGSAANLDSLELIDPRTLANFIRNEHPQTMALILAHLEAKKCGETLKILPETLHTEILMRIARLDAVQPEIINEIDDVLRQEIQAMGSIHTQKIGGVEPIAEMLNLIDKATEEQILDSLEERDPDMAEKIRKLMFTFDDLVKIDDRGIQELIKNVNNDKWKIALKTASESVRDLVFKNMSERAAKMLREDMEAMSAVKLTDVENLQSEIVQIARKLEQEGKIIIASGDSAYV